MDKKISPAYFFAIAFFLLAGFASMAAVAKNDSANNSGNKNENAKSEKSEKIVKTDTNKTQKVDLKNYQKPDVNKGETNAKVYKEKTDEVIKGLEEEVSTKTQNMGEEQQLNVEVKNKVKKQVEAVVAEEEANQEQTTEAIEEVENDGPVKKFLVGPDYKNLGQLRSALVHNRNQIRQMTMAINTLTQNGEDASALTAQLALLTQERERIKNIITTNQDTFSLLGWVARFLNNYEQTPVDDAEEEKLIDEVEEAVENSETTAPTDTSATGESTTPTDTTTTTSTDNTTNTNPTDTTTTPTTTTTTETTPTVVP